VICHRNNGLGDMGGKKEAKNQKGAHDDNVQTVERTILELRGS
jgi:hypothetical protein